MPHRNVRLIRCALFSLFAVCTTAFSPVTVTHERLIGNTRTLKPLDCSLSGAVGKPVCVGILPYTPEGTPPDLDNVRSLVAKTFDFGQTQTRLTVSGVASKDKQQAITLINTDARNIDFNDIPANKMVLIGGIFYESGGKGDIRYTKAGNSLKGGLGKRLVFVVIRKSSKDHFRWEMYGHTEANVYAPLHSGTVGMCTHNGKEDVPWADFNNCVEDEALHELAQAAPGVNIVALRVAAHCDLSIIPDSSSGGPSSEAGLREACRTQTLPNLSILLKDYFMAAKAKRSELLENVFRAQNPGTDPYWFACGSQCCTADM